MAGLIHPVGIDDKSFFVIESQGLFCPFELPGEYHVGNNASAGPALAVVAVHSHNSILGLYLRKTFTFHVLEYVVADVEESRQGRRLMIGPEIVLHQVAKQVVVVLAHADVDDQTFALMHLLEILRDVVD